jgi:hypothetical protein
MKKLLLLLFISVFFTCCEKLSDRCNCELKGQEVSIDYKNEYYWIEIDTESEVKLFGPYASPSHGYAAIKRCLDLERNCN